MVRRNIPAPRNVLMSYHYFKDYDLDRLPHLTIIGDSGAFSARSQGITIGTKELAGWAKRWQHKLKWVASLDVIGNPVMTYSNWREMVDVYGVQAVPTIHYGTHPQELDKYARRGVDLVGLGGLVKVPTNAQMRWLIQVFKYAAEHHPDMQFHGWGCTSAPHFRLPFYSVDSSSWTAGVRYGAARLVDPRTGKNVSYRLNNKDAFQPDVARLLADFYGISPRAASFSNSSNRDAMVRIHALAESAREQWWNRQHGPVKVPSWGVNPNSGVIDQRPARGRSIHLATALIENAAPHSIERVFYPAPDTEPRSIHLACSGDDPHSIERVCYSTPDTEPRAIHLATTGPYFP